MNDNNRNIEFIKCLYEEKLKHKEHRRIYVTQKLLFMIGLFGLGAPKIKIGEMTYTTELFLFFIPFVATAYDIYIFAEDFKVKRIGFFIRQYVKKEREIYCEIELNWEKWVSSHREGLAEKASFILTLIATGLSAIFIYGKNYKPGMEFHWYVPNKIFVYWFLLAFTLIFISFKFYKNSKKKLIRELLRVSPITISSGLISGYLIGPLKFKKNKSIQMPKEMINRFDEEFLYVPGNPFIKLNKKNEIEILEKRRGLYKILWWIKPIVYILSENPNGEKNYIVKQIR